MLVRVGECQFRVAIRRQALSCSGLRRSKPRSSRSAATSIRWVRKRASCADLWTTSARRLRGCRGGPSGGASGVIDTSARLAADSAVRLVAKGDVDGAQQADGASTQQHQSCCHHRRSPPNATRQMQSGRASQTDPAAITSRCYPNAALRYAIHDTTRIHAGRSTLPGRLTQHKGDPSVVLAGTTWFGDRLFLRTRVPAEDNFVLPTVRIMRPGAIDPMSTA